MSDDRYRIPDELRMNYDDLVDWHQAQVDGALLGLAAHPEDMQQACYASGQESWETFSQGLEFAALCGLAEEVRYGKYVITAAGRQHGIARLEEEQAARAAGRLTRREASLAHADILYQHVLKGDEPVCRKLWAVMHGEPAEPLTDAEAELAAVHIEMQTGPIQQDLIDRLRSGQAR